MRVLNASGVSLPMSNVAVHLGSKSRQIFNDERRSLVVAVLDAISRNRFRKSRRVSMASRSGDGALRFCTVKIESAFSSRAVISVTSMSSNIDNEAVLVATSSSYIVRPLQAA